jgi:Homeobox KN domain
MSRPVRQPLSALSLADNNAAFSPKPALLKKRPEMTVDPGSEKKLDTKAVFGVAMPRMIFPVRRIPESNGGRRHQDHVVQYVALDPLKWIEKLSGDAEKEESRLNRGKIVAPIRLNGVGLSFQHPVITSHSREVSETYEWKKDAGPQRKRVRVAHDEQYKTRRLLSEDETSTWDLSNLIQDVSQPIDLVERLQTMVTAVESLGPSSPSSKAGYRRIRDRFSERLQQILEIQKSDAFASPVHISAMLDELYEDTIRKLQVLEEMLESEDRHEAIAAKYLRPTDTPDKTVAKDDFTPYMIKWLRDNWTNPYPDDDGLAEMAKNCGTSIAVVNNWLINARTRKWRPAIVKALETKRPSALLLEDSLNIFDGLPLRKIQETHHGITRKTSVRTAGQPNNRLV